MKYMGSKLRIAPYITQYINDIAFNENITEYYEPFMGGCSVGELVQIQNRHLSDINPHMVALMKKSAGRYVGLQVHYKRRMVQD